MDSQLRYPQCKKLVLVSVPYVLNLIWNAEKIVQISFTIFDTVDVL